MDWQRSDNLMLPSHNNWKLRMVFEIIIHQNYLTIAIKQIKKNANRNSIKVFFVVNILNQRTRSLQISSDI